MDSAVLLGLVVAIVTPILTAAISFGAIRAQSRGMEKRLDRFEASVGRFGERVGSMEKDLTVLLDRERRRSYVGIVRGAVPASEDSSE
jgi:hypothetical protein